MFIINKGPLHSTDNDIDIIFGYVKYRGDKLELWGTQ